MHDSDSGERLPSAEGGRTAPARPGRARTRTARGGRRSRDAVRGKVRAHDPFELIRWLALSQPDPRKALAELVQNSLDAGARKIHIRRARHAGTPCLSIHDDGEGVIPEMDRPEALRYIATHIGHSRKRDLSPEERLRLMTQGQYGIGLLGFWSLGQTLEMRTCLPGQRPHRLILHRDRPDFVIEPLRGRLPVDGRWTEIVVVSLHKESIGLIGGRRAAEYLASELRGQLLSRQVDVVVEDRMSRGRSKRFNPVRPVRFLGEPLGAIGPLSVPGHSSIRLEIYFAEGAEDGGVHQGLAIYSSGTLIAEGFHQLGHLGLDHPPWTDSRLTGLVDYPDFRVTPGSRRGLVADEAATAFACALGAAEPMLDSLLDGLEKRRMEELDRGLIRDLQRAFRGFYRQRPRYAMLPVRNDGKEGPPRDVPPGEGVGTDEAAGAPERAPGPDTPGPGEHEPIPPGDLLPPGPLALARITPSPVRLECGGARQVRAAALDAVGRPIDEPVTFQWRLDGEVGHLEDAEPSGASVLLKAADSPAEGLLAVIARSGEREAAAEAPVEVLEEIPARGSDEGIPDPELLDQPGAAWRSRMDEGRWQVNVGHREYRAIAGQPALKLRYLAMLFAKEVVLRSSQDPRLERPLEQLVEVAAYADRNLRVRKRQRRRPARSGGS